MAHQMPPVGLCLTCNNLASCFHRKRRGFDAVYCEMFDNYVPSRDNGGGQEESGSLSGAVVIGSGILNDLCVNCTNQATCRLPKPTGGVWHCEEYL